MLNSIIKGGVMQVVIDSLVKGAVPIYEKSKDEDSVVATDVGFEITQGVDKNSRVVVPLFPVTAKFLRSMAKTLDMGRKIGKWSAVIMVSPTDDKAGLLCV
jgi:hypothetical protein